MKKYILLLVLIATTVQAQRSVRIGYIDMEYILQNAPNYTEAKNQLEQKAQKWKQEIETKKNEISKLRESLLSEKVLLTKELIEERETEIKLQETALADFQEKKFGPLGELVTQKTLLVQPVQDQVFNIVQDIAEAKKYDFIFDRASDLTMLFADKRYDVSGLVVRKLNNATKAETRTKKQQLLEEAKEKALEAIEENPNLAEKEKQLAKSKEDRQKLIDAKKAEREALKKAQADKRKQEIADNLAKRNSGTVSVSNYTTTPTDNTNKPSETNTAATDKAKAAEERRLAKEKEVADRKQALEEKRLKNLADREAARLAKEAAKNNK